MLNCDAEWLKEVKFEDLPSAYRDVAETIGIEAAVKLSSTHGGSYIYFPKIEGILERVRNLMIRKDADAMLRSGLPSGDVYRALVKKYKLTEQWLRQIVDGQKQEGQQELF